MTETVRLSYGKSRELAKESRENGTQKKMLSLKDDSRIRIVFQSRRNLKAVAEKTGEVYGKPFFKMERQQADHSV